MTDLRKAAEMILEAKDIEELLLSKIILRQALAQDKQEPVIDRRLKVKIGRQYGYALNEHWFYLQPADEYAEQALTKHSGISVPPKREWVGLTNEEIDEAIKSCKTTDTYKYFRAIEAKLKEKNYD